MSFSFYRMDCSHLYIYLIPVVNIPMLSNRCFVNPFSYNIKEVVGITCYAFSIQRQYSCCHVLINSFF